MKKEPSVLQFVNDFFFFFCFYRKLTPGKSNEERNNLFKSFVLDIALNIVLEICIYCKLLF